MKCFSCEVGQYKISIKTKDFVKSEDMPVEIVCDNCGKEFDDEAALKLIKSFEDKNE